MHLDEAIAKYGDPHRTGFYGTQIVNLPLPGVLKYTDPHGVVLPVHTVRVHRLLAGQFSEVFADVLDAGLWALIADFGGTYVVRDIRGTTGHLSAHAFGAAIDVNPHTLPLGSDKRQDPRIDAVFAKHGFTNGADFHHRKDPMHYTALGF